VGGGVVWLLAVMGTGTVDSFHSVRG